MLAFWHDRFNPDHPYQWKKPPGFSPVVKTNLATYNLYNYEAAQCMFLYMFHSYPHSIASFSTPTISPYVENTWKYDMIQIPLKPIKSPLIHHSTTGIEPWHFRSQRLGSCRWSTQPRGLFSAPILGPRFRGKQRETMVEWWFTMFHSRQGQSKLLKTMKTIDLTSENADVKIKSHNQLNSWKQK